MLSTLIRKLCPLLTIAVATVGCGKKIVDNNKIQNGRTTENQELPSVYVIRLDGRETSRKNYHLISDAQFNIPDRLFVRHGNTRGKIVEISHDVNEHDSEDYFYKCIYVPSIEPSEMILSKCVDYDDDDFGDVSNNTFTLYKNDIIQMRFTGDRADDLVVEAVYSMNWIYSQN